MTDKPLVIPIDKIKSDFQTFLAPAHNKRIIFSGPFGIGKTYFLNEFFNEKEEYFPIFLRPINYSLLSNEDVFRFIKYDILAQLIAKKKIDIDKEIEIPTSENLKSFLKNNKLLVLKNLLKIIPKLGGFSDSIDAVEELYLEYRKAKENLSTELSAEQIKIFNDDFEDHFLSEFDNVSTIIKQKIEEENKQCVLVIDDLDRLDPEHVFRLFNVFSAHFDQVHYYENEDGNDNKFGFDKIIFVCDIENIRKIFAHKYGSEVDFSGYIDKFYSTELFKFLQVSDFRNIIYPFLEDRILKGYEDHYSSGFYNCTKIILQILYESQQLSIRDLKKINYVTFYELYTERETVMLHGLGAPRDSYINYYGILISFKLLFAIFTDKSIFYKKIKLAIANKKFKDSGFFRQELATLTAQLILFSEINVHNFSHKRDNNFSYALVNGKSLEYNLFGQPASDSFPNGPMRYKVKISTNNEISIADFANLLLSAIKNIDNLNLV